MLRCLHVREETHDVKTFVFGTREARSFRYLPGQFITLRLEIDARPVQRCYTLSSTPTRPDRVSITVKRVPGGPVSNWLHEHLRAGMALAANGPAGEFSCFVAPAERYLFLSGGSGITPLMSMTRALHDLGSRADIVFVHCARSPADLIFAEELALIARDMAQFRLALVCEQHLAGSAYAGHLGRLDAARLVQIAPDLARRDIYNCGPAPFMAAVRAGLASLQFDMARYREESFLIDAPELAPHPQESGGIYKIRLKQSGMEFSCGAEQTILQAAAAAGLRLPFSCSAGMCGTCKTRKISGQVRIAHAGGIRQREIDQGWILPCCSRPESDVELDR